MAVYHHPPMTGDLEQFIAHVDRTITATSVTAKVEGSTDRGIGGARMVVRVYERYSAIGGNRLTLTIAALGAGGKLEVSAITSGGSTGMFWKVNTFGEEAFLQRAVDAICGYAELSVS